MKVITVRIEANDNGYVFSAECGTRLVGPIFGSTFDGLWIDAKEAVLRTMNFGEAK